MLPLLVIPNQSPELEKKKNTPMQEGEDGNEFVQITTFLNLRYKSFVQVNGYTVYMYCLL